MSVDTAYDQYREDEEYRFCDDPSCGCTSSSAVTEQSEFYEELALYDEIREHHLTIGINEVPDMPLAFNADAMTLPITFLRTADGEQVKQAEATAFAMLMDMGGPRVILGITGWKALGYRAVDPERRTFRQRLLAFLGR